jgi:hypothetical protein
VQHSFELFFVVMDVLNEVASYISGSGTSYETNYPSHAKCDGLVV